MFATFPSNLMEAALGHLHNGRDRVVQGKGVGGNDGGGGGNATVVVEVGRGSLPERFADAARGDAAEVTLDDHLPRRGEEKYRLDHGLPSRITYRCVPLLPVGLVVE